MGDAELARFIDRYTVEYVRVYAHPIERVWRAITEPAEFGVWFIRGTMDSRAGGSYRFGPEGSTDFAGVVLRAEPPHFIRFGKPDPYDGGYFQYELTTVEAGTRLRFVEHFPPDGVYSETARDLGGDLPAGPGTPWKPGFVGGWHEYWDALADFMDGVLVGSRLAPTHFGELSAVWTQKMVRAGVFTPGQAERVALSLRRHERWDELNRVYRAHIEATVPPAAEQIQGS